MADKITVIACEQDGDEYKILLSNGSEAHASRAYEPGEEYVGEPTSGGCVYAYTAPGADSPAYLSINYVNGALRVSVRSQGSQSVSEINLDSGTEIEFRKAMADKLRDDNAMLQRGLEEANAVIANLTQQNKDLTAIVSELHQQHNVAPVPAGLIGVTTARVDNLPSLEQLPAHPTMLPPAEPGEPETPDQRDVRLHIERKRAARAVVTDAAVEGTEPQE